MVMDRESTSVFEGLNKAQREAVDNISGPSLIIAGAGSGKTRVITCKIARILQTGCPAESVLALTFTNKASREMRERIAAIVGERTARRLWMGTFHSIFIRFLREESELLGFPKNFTIYDTSDSRNVIKSCIKELKLDDKIYKPNEVYSRISLAKNNLVTAQAYGASDTIRQTDAASKKPRISDIYTLYAEKCRNSAAMDFDDILLFTNILFKRFPDALDRIASRFNYILVDEYQDTNYAQYLIVNNLARRHGNITVVGDDSQSIYAFRGARIENIINFKRDYPSACEYRLERNYRSTRTIVNAANSLIAKNSHRLKKECFSQGETGEKIELINAFTEQEEGLLVAGSIVNCAYRERESYGDFAILYRTNSQSRTIEEALRKRNIPYKIFAGHSFYERAEVKDMLGYLKFVQNTKDNESFRRIINFPARGIGATTMERLTELVRKSGLPYSEVIKGEKLEEAGIKGATVRKLKKFIAEVERIGAQLPNITAYQAACMINECFAITANMQTDTSLEGQSRLENVVELFNSIKEFVEGGEAEYESLAAEGYDVPLMTLDMYLENVSLISDLDTKEGEEDKNKVSLMTVHSSKGLEFDYVYIVGMEENLFPSSSGFSPEDEIEEERRLFYVALTRARKGVKLSFARSRMKWGSHVNNAPSRFIREIDRAYILNPLPDISSANSYDNYLSSQSFFSRTYSKTPDFSSPGRGNSSSLRAGTPSGRPLRAAMPNPEFKADPQDKVAAGQIVEHNLFGRGKVLSIEGDLLSRKAVVEFDGCGKKTLMLKFAKIRIIK